MINKYVLVIVFLKIHSVTNLEAQTYANLYRSWEGWGDYNIIENALALMKISSEWIIAEEERRGHPRRADCGPDQAPAALMPSARTSPC
jgi:hypothetical protein